MPIYARGSRKKRPGQSARPLVIDRVAKLQARAAYLKQELRDKLIDHRRYIDRVGEDLPEIRDWQRGG